MKAKIKICGLKTLEDIFLVNQFPISYAGFIFAQGSKRQISIEQAKKMKKALRKNIKAVGVFTNTDIETINEFVDIVGLDIVQLHSNETNEDCKKANTAVWKMISVKDESSLNEIQYFQNADGILLDTYHKELLGGTGESFCWDLVKGISKQKFLILAGGLNPQNIIEAEKIVQPHVLDINSGVETDGKKDKTKLEELFARRK